MDQLQPITSTLPNSQTVPVGSFSSMPSSISSLKPNEQMRFIESLAPYGTGPQNVSSNSSAISMIPKANNSGFQPMGVPKNDFKDMGVLISDTKSQHMQLPIKRKSPMENLSGYPSSLGMPMSNNKIGQMEHRPWFNTFASNKNNVHHQMQFADSVPVPQQLVAQNRRTTQFQAGPPPYGSQKPSTPRSHSSQGQPSPKVQNQLNESIRSKLRESVSAALALVTEKEKPSSLVATSASASANASEKIQEGSQSAEITPSASHAELSGEIQTEANQDCSTQTENNVKSELTVVDCDVGGSLQILDGIGQESDMIDILPEEGTITDNIFAKDDLLQGNGFAWVRDFDAWIAEKEGHGPLKQKVGENAGEVREVKKSSPRNLALQIELELFKLFGGVNKKYKEKGRSLLFNLKDKNNPELREKVMSGEISPARLCSMSAEELASKELSEWRIAKAEEFEQMKILPDSDIGIRRLVKKTHKGDIQVEVEDDDVSVEVSVGSSSFPRIQTKAKETVPQSGQKSNDAEQKTINGKANSEEQNLQCAITISSNESSDLMQGLIEDDRKDAEFLPPIVSLDEFMESLHSEPPFENLPPDADKNATSSDNDHAEVPSESNATKLSPGGRTIAASETQDSSDTKDPQVDSDIKPTDSQPHTDISPPVLSSRGEHIWEGSLQLSITYTIAVNGLFISGEKASTNDWPRTMDIKGRVRLDAFEKFLQDLYKSQSRSIMVMRVILKEDKEKETEALSQVVDSYVADDRVGFAEPLRGLEVYLCPSHPKILDRIEKHLVKDKKEAITLTGDDKGLIGVVVSRKANLSPNTSSHHKHGFKKHQQEHYASRRHTHHQDRNIKVNASILTSEYPVLPLVSSKATYSAAPAKVAMEEDDVPPGFGPQASQDDDDLPEFNFSGRLSRPIPTQMPIGYQTQSQPTDQMRELVQKYGQTAASAGSGRVGNWKDDEDDIPEWQPQVTFPAPQPTPPHINYPPLNQPTLQHLINQQQQLLRPPFQQHSPAPLHPPMPAAQHPGWSQSGVWLNPRGSQQGQFYGAQSRGF